MNALENSKKISERVETLRDELGDSVTIEEIAEVVESLMTTMQGDISALEFEMHREIRGLVNYISVAKSEIAAIRPQEINEKHIPVASDELDAVVQATEDATGTILDAAEELETLGDELGERVADRIAGITAKIYEASNFQDITGQRITKVVNTLRYIESKVQMLAAALGEDGASHVKSSVEETAGDEALLNGPQLPQAANSQEEIDALLASFD